MIKIALPLRTSFVDNLHPDINSEMKFNFKNSLDRVEIDSDIPKSIHTIIIKNGEDINYENSDSKELSRILAISASIASDNVIFRINDRGSSFGLKITDDKISYARFRAMLNIKSDVTSIADVEFNESLFIKISKNLLKLSIFELVDVPKKQNFFESINEYELAINSENRYESFKHLYNSLEKMVNLEKDYGHKFDSIASSLCGVSEDELSKFRKCNNRFKHSSNNPKKAKELVECRKKLPQTINNLKKAVDNVIILRINLNTF